MDDLVQEDSLLTEERWQAIIDNNANYEHPFFYGVRTTGIFCRPSCKSRPPKKENVRIFFDASQALAENFRPCKRCKPCGQRLPDEEWVDQITRYIDRHFADTITLELLAEECHGSPYHLQRTFKRIKHMTPVEYIQRKRIETAQKYMLETNKSFADISKYVGFSSVSYFTTLFKRLKTRTPAEFRAYYADKLSPEDQSYEQTL